MYYVDTKLIMRNIGRKTGEPHFTAGDWLEGTYEYPSKQLAEEDIIELKSTDDPDTSFCRWEYRLRFVSVN